MGKLLVFQRPDDKREGPYFCGAPMGPYGKYPGSPQARSKEAPKASALEQPGEDSEEAR